MRARSTHQKCRAGAHLFGEKRGNTSAVCAGRELLAMLFRLDYVALVSRLVYCLSAKRKAQSR
jgi:hypothetical protein